MQKKVFQIVADNTSGVLSRVSGLFSRRGYNIESITAGEGTDPRYTRVTIVTSGEKDVLEQIEKQVAKLEDIEAVKELAYNDSVFRELALIKVKTTKQERDSVISMANIFRANIVDVANESLIIEVTGNSTKIDAFIKVLDGYEILEIARTGIAGLSRGVENGIYL